MRDGAAVEAARINGVMQPTHGTACLQPDGTWGIVS
jgi:surface antigen